MLGRLLRKKTADDVINEMELIKNLHKETDLYTILDIKFEDVANSDTLKGILNTSVLNWHPDRNFGVKTDISHGTPFICENTNRTTNLIKEHKKMLFLPDTFFMGSMKGDPTIHKFLQFLNVPKKFCNYTSEFNFLGTSRQWCLDAIKQKEFFILRYQNRFMIFQHHLGIII